jgi:hypothetical protein
VRQLEPLYGQNLATLPTNRNTSQESPAQVQAELAGCEARPSQAGPSRPMWDRLPSVPFTPVPHRHISSTETPPWCNDFLVPIKRYTGDVDLSILLCIGQRLGDDDYDEANSKFQVIGLTKDVIIVMETKAWTLWSRY